MAMILLDSNIIIYLSKEIANKAIELKQQYDIKLPDAVICATAIVKIEQRIEGLGYDFAKIRQLSKQEPSPLAVQRDN